jgi:type IV secretory pathway VirB10-like protein
MRRWSLVLLLTTTSPVLAQEAQEAPAAPAPAAQEAEPAPAAQKPARRRRAPQPEQAAVAPAPTPAAQPPASAQSELPQVPSQDSVEEQVRDEARYLLSYLLTGDVRGSVPMLSFPFQLEERRFDTPESLVVTWVKQLRQKRTDLVTLYDVEVLPYAELETKYGKPPARLGTILPRKGEVYAAVANLSGRAAVILYRQEGEGWKAFAYTD